MAAYGPFAATERVLMAMGKAGADRQEGHERLRRHALDAWAALRSGASNDLAERVASDPWFSGTLGRDGVLALMVADAHTGSAPGRAREMAKAIRSEIGV